MSIFNKKGIFILIYVTALSSSAISQELNNSVSEVEVRAQPAPFSDEKIKEGTRIIEKIYASGCFSNSHSNNFGAIGLEPAAGRCAGLLNSRQINTLHEKLLEKCDWRERITAKGKVRRYRSCPAGISSSMNQADIIFVSVQYFSSRDRPLTLP